MRIFESLIIRVIYCSILLFFNSVFASFGIRVMLALSNESGRLPFSSVFWNSLRRAGINFSMNVWYELFLCIFMKKYRGNRDHLACRNNISQPQLYLYFGLDNSLLWERGGEEIEERRCSPGHGKSVAASLASSH